jgi:DNA-binding winged helix-turn-helix (wHTH) protein
LIAGGRLVAKEELMRRAFGLTPSSKNQTLPSTFSRFRKDALGDKRTPNLRYVETVARGADTDLSQK